MPRRRPGTTTGVDRGVISVRLPPVFPTVCLSTVCPPAGPGALRHRLTRTDTGLGPGQAGRPGVGAAHGNGIGHHPSGSTKYAKKWSSLSRTASLAAMSDSATTD